jgi:hypothetical protein
MKEMRDLKVYRAHSSSSPSFAISLISFFYTVIIMPLLTLFSELPTKGSSIQRHLSEKEKRKMARPEEVTQPTAEELCKPENTNWVQPRRFRVEIPAIRHPHCLGRLDREGKIKCNRPLDWEPHGWRSLEFDLICNQLWMEEQLSPMFEDLADITLCQDHRTQIPSNAKMWEKMVWKHGFIVALDRWTRDRGQSSDRLESSRKRELRDAFIKRQGTGAMAVQMPDDPESPVRYVRQHRTDELKNMTSVRRTLSTFVRGLSLRGGEGVE